MGNVTFSIVERHTVVDECGQTAEVEIIRDLPIAGTWHPFGLVVSRCDDYPAVLLPARAGHATGTTPTPTKPEE